MRKLAALALAAALSSSQALAFAVQGPSWDTDKGPVVYQLHPDGSDDVEGEADLDEVRDAFRLWSCVEGSSLRFLEGDEPGEKVESTTDGRNNVFWDEDNTFALGPGTFSVTRTSPFIPGEPAVRDDADIILNGFDHEWTTGTPADDEHLPIFNVMVREIGVMIGLDVECLDPNDPATCPPPEETVMSPYIPGAPREALADDDVAAVQALYGTDDGSSCQGPFRQGEPCSCNGDCVGGMVCAPDSDGKNVCSPTCTSEDASCPSGFGCVLAARASDDEAATGQCVRAGSDGLRPVASTCENDRQCAEGLCASLPAVGRTACRVSCDSASDCPDQYVCSDGHCTWGGETSGIACEAPPDDTPSCACGAATRGDGALAGLGWAAALFALSLVTKRAGARTPSPPSRRRGRARAARG